ncbi:MAG: M23 family metallopeptidase [Bacteroidia bacterium]|nr:M23 family metallopeptidase [Bacteroidia bacterium]
MRKVLLIGCFIAVAIAIAACRNTIGLGEIHDSSQSTLVGAQNGKKDLKVQQAHLRTIDPFDIDIIPTSRPVPEGVPLSSMFGMRNHPILKVEKMHTGIDFPAPTGTPVMATATGRVNKLVLGNDSSSYGKHIILEHDEIFCTLYAHLSRVNVIPGQIVEEGDTIGFVGSTGRSTNPHLHYEVIRDGIRIDPEDFL